MERIAESLLEDPASARRIQQLFEAIKAAARVAGSDQLRGPS
jgi:hypothetical protein